MRISQGMHGMDKRKQMVLGFIVLFTLLPVGAFSQAYIPLAVDGKHWIVKTLVGDTVLTIDQLGEYYCMGDTVIEEKAYKKIYKRYLDPTIQGPPFYPLAGYSLFAYLRDDIINRKVYAWTNYYVWYEDCPSYQDNLIYDFSLQAGDSITQCLMPSKHHAVLDSISNENVFNEDTRIFHTSYRGQRFFEGIGNDRGLFETIDLPPDNLSYKEYTELYYYCPESPCEYIVSSVSNLITKSEVCIYPNPANDYINVKSFSSLNQPNYSIYSPDGKVVLSGTIYGEIMKIDISSLDQGSYFISINDPSNVKYKKLIVIR